MHLVNMHTAKSTLSQLVEATLQGEDVVIARNGKPLVRLVAVAQQQQAIRPIGLGATGLPMIANSEFELMSATNPDSFEESTTDPLNS